MPEQFESQNQGELAPDDLENLLTKEEQKRLEDAKPEIERIFTLAPEERKSLLLNKFQPFFATKLIDEQTIGAEIENCAAATTQEEFLKKINKLAVEFMLTSRKDVDDVVRKAVLAEKGRTIINDILDYETTPDGQIIKIHLVPSKKPGIKKLKELMISGLDDLAEIVKKNEGVLTVEAYSWIVAKHPELVEKLGFTLGEKYVTHDGKEGRGGEISREKFLTKPWKPKEQK